MVPVCQRDDRAVCGIVSKTETNYTSAPVRTVIDVVEVLVRVVLVI